MGALRRPRSLIVAAVIIVAIGVMTPSIVRGMGGVLVATDALAPADVIVLPGWTNEPGALEAADLYKRGIASRVAVLGPAPEPAREELIRRGAVGEGPPWVVSLREGVRAARRSPA